MITDVLHGIVVESAAGVLDFVAAERRWDDLDQIEENIAAEDPEEEEEEEEYKKKEEAPVDNRDSPLFEIEVYDEDGMLIFGPTSQAVNHEVEMMVRPTKPGPVQPPHFACHGHVDRTRVGRVECTPGDRVRLSVLRRCNLLWGQSARSRACPLTKRWQSSQSWWTKKR